jgi:hypothetical protein
MLINSYALGIIAGIYALLSISVRIVHRVQEDVNLITPPTVQPPLYQPPTPCKVEAAGILLLCNEEPSVPRSLRLVISLYTCGPSLALIRYSNVDGIRGGERGAGNADLQRLAKGMVVKEMERVLRGVPCLIGWLQVSILISIQSHEFILTVSKDYVRNITSTEGCSPWRLMTVQPIR